MLLGDPNSGGEGDDPNKIHFKLWRFVEFDVSGKEAIHAGKPYLYFGVVCLALTFLLLYSTQAAAIRHLISIFIR
jgi:hypothetical protein